MAIINKMKSQVEAEQKAGLNLLPTVPDGTKLQNYLRRKQIRLVDEGLRGSGSKVTPEAIANYAATHGKDSINHNLVGGMDTSYVVGFVMNTDVPDNVTFVIVWSTIRMLEFPSHDESLMPKLIHGDDTNGANWMNWPVIIGGHTDMERQFMVAFTALSTNKGAKQYKDIFKIFFMELAY
jgi:hypothetical protein